MEKQLLQDFRGAADEVVERLTLLDPEDLSSATVKATAALCIGTLREIAVRLDTLIGART